jgi:hypothetical protein
MGESVSWMAGLVASLLPRMSGTACAVPVFSLLILPA